MNFNTDNSTQSITSLSLITGSYNGVATKADVNLKQDLLTASTVLLGIGSNLSALDYNKITLNKPTNFQSDWNSTIINKPTNFQSDWNSTIINKPVIYTQTEVNNISNSCANFTISSSNINSNYTYVSSNILNTKINTKQDILTYYPIDPAIYYNKTQTDTLLNAKEAILTFNTPLSRSVNAISIDLSNYYLKTNIDNFLLQKEAVLTFSAPLTRTTNTIGINLNSYVPFTALSASNYITNANNTLIYYPTYTVLNSCNYITNSTSTLVNYYTKTSIDSSLATKEAILTFNAPLSRSVNAVSIDLTNYYNKTEVNGLSNNNSNYTYNSSNILNSKINGFLILSGGSLTGDLNTNSKFLTTNNTNFGIPTVSTTGTGDKIIFTNGGTNFYPNSIGLENAGSLWISSCNNFKFYNNSINSMTIQGNGAVGIGTTQNFNNASYKLDVRGDLIASSLTSIDNNKNWVSYITTSTSGFTNFQTGGVSLAFQPDLNIQPIGGHLFLGNNNPTSNVFINSSKVGIGTTSLLSSSTWKLDVRGFIGTNAIYVAENTNYGGNQFQLMITPPSSTSSAGIQTIQQNVGFNQNLLLQNSGGNVGIGTNPTSGIKLEVAGQIRASGGANIGTCQLSQGSSGAQCGYLAFNNSSGTRCGYIGWNYVINGTTNYLFLATENSYGGYCLNGSLVVGSDNNNPQIQMGSTNGHNLGIASSAGTFSTSASAGDLVLRSINKLHLQSGTGGASITINSANNVGIGNIVSPQQMLDVNGSLLLRVAEWSSGGTKGLFFRDGYTGTGNQYNCSILTYDHLGDGFCDGLSINAWDGVSFCTGSNGRQERMRINSSGNMGVGTDAPRTKLDVVGVNPSITIRSSAGEWDNSVLYFGTGVSVNAPVKCAIIAQGQSSWSRAKLHFCLDNTADNTYPNWNASTVNSRMTINPSGCIGIGNVNPIEDGSTTQLCIGNAFNAYSDGAYIFGKNNGTGGSRQYKIGVNASFYIGIGDYGNNNTAGTFTRQLLISYQAYSAQLIMENDAKNYGQFVNTSDERIKSNIRNIDNALNKILLLEGKNYTLIEENTEEIGLIAQDVELIIPEAVKECSLTNLKAINYQGLVGLLVEGIKDQQKQINELKTILKNNNLY
jgi:hypothetical protein